MSEREFWKRMQWAERRGALPTTDVARLREHERETGMPRDTSAADRKAAYEQRLAMQEYIRRRDKDDKRAGIVVSPPQPTILPESRASYWAARAKLADGQPSPMRIFAKAKEQERDR